MRTRPFDWLKAAWLSVAIAASIVAVAEVAVRAVERHTSWLGPSGSDVNGPGEHAIIASRPWGPRYLADLRGFHWRHHYAPHVGYRSVPHASESVNVDDWGIRRTLHGSSEPSAAVVYACGGSTMIGVGVPDWGTIPSYLARDLNAGASARPVRVVNRAQAWWTSGQALMDLVVALQHGERPEVVLFASGINDFAVVSYGGQPGGIAPYAEMLLDRGLSRAWFHDGPGTLATLHFPALLRRWLGPSGDVEGSAVSRRTGGRTPPSGDLAGRLREAAAVYEANVRMLRVLAAAYGFEVYFFLEPFPLISPRPLTAEEAREIGPLWLPWERALAEDHYARLRGSPYLRSLPDFIDVSNALDGVDETILLDTEHLLPQGNEIVAAAMIRGLQRVQAAFLGGAPAEGPRRPAAVGAGPSGFKQVTSKPD